MVAMPESTPVATFLPLTSLKDFSAKLDFLRWLKQTDQNGWLMAPISDPIATPYRNYGFGYAQCFLSPASSPSSSAVSEVGEWVLDRQEFLTQNRDWVNLYAFHQALSEHFQTDAWWTWPDELHYYQSEALDIWRLKLQDRIGFFLDQQYNLANQFALLRQNAHEENLQLIGDLPFYIAQESPLVWANQECFLLRKNGHLDIQSGVPALPDEPFAAQFWGHPLYDWQGEHFSDIINIFNLRLQFLASTFDLVRLDHANGFFRYGMMYPQHPNWCKKVAGPGKKALNLILEHAQTLGLGLFFENIGSQTLYLEQYLKEHRRAGMSVLTLAYNLDGQRPNSNPLKINRKAFNLNSYKGNQVVFTSTHDTLPLLSWLENLPLPVKNKFRQVNSFSPDLKDTQLADLIIKRLRENSAKLLIIPWQDWQHEVFRFNVPGHEELAAWQHQIDIKKYLR